MKDIQVFTALDAKTVAAEKLDILLLSTEGAADMATYNDLEKLKAAFPGKKVAAMADKMFNQDNTLADTLIRKVRVAGIENPQNVGGTASRIEIAFGENMPTETLEASTAYYAKIGGKVVVEITTGEEAPADCAGLAKLFAGTSFEEDGVEFTAAVDDNTVTYTSTTRTAVSGYAESICGDGNFIDNVLGADYITHQIRENLYEIFIANKKIAYTDDGFALVAAGVFAALNRAVELHIIATDPEDDTGVYTVVIPKRADATDEQARNRQMPDIKWSAQLEGAVHSVKVNGTLRVTLNG